MIGFYDYTVVLTYFSFAVSLVGMLCSINGRFNWAIFCLALSGLCDMFDGKVARTKKNRTEDEKSFGIQIDSLCDVVCFGAAPAILCYQLGMKGTLGVLLLIFYGLAGVIRLGYFNVMEEKRQHESAEVRKYYQGLPITSMAIALPVYVVLQPVFTNSPLFVWGLHALVATVGLLFISNIKVKKLAPKELLPLVLGLAVIVLFLLFFWKRGRFML